MEGLLGELLPRATLCLLACARLLPVAWLCPLFGGRLTPAPIRLGIGLALSLLLGVAGVPVAAAATLVTLVPACLREVCLGTALGLVAAAPYEAARFGGQLTDLLRGTSAEAALPGVGTREAATAEVLAQAALVLGLGAGALGWMVRALLRSTLLVPLGAPVTGPASAIAVAAAVGGILATGLALAAPVAGLALVVDAVVGFAARGGSAPALGEVATPARILGGAGVLWLAFGVVADRILAMLAASPDAVLGLVERFR
jgi:flagellar biosynthesis protein FliR